MNADTRLMLIETKRRLRNFIVNGAWDRWIGGSDEKRPLDTDRKTRIQVPSYTPWIQATDAYIVLAIVMDSCFRSLFFSVTWGV